MTNFNNTEEKPTPISEPLFFEDGHLTLAAFNLLEQQAETDLLSRLEIAEHIAFCDDCLLMYTEHLEGAELKMPPQPIAPAVKQRLREKEHKLKLVPALTAAACACLVMAVWLTGAPYFKGALAQGVNISGQQAFTLAGPVAAANMEETYVYKPKTSLFDSFNFFSSTGTCSSAGGAGGGQVREEIVAAEDYSEQAAKTDIEEKRE